MCWLAVTEPNSDATQTTKKAAINADSCSQVRGDKRHSAVAVLGDARAQNICRGIACDLLSDILHDRNSQIYFSCFTVASYVQKHLRGCSLHVIVIVSFASHGRYAHRTQL